MDEPSKQKDEMLPGRDKRAADTPALPLNGIFLSPALGLEREEEPACKWSFLSRGAGVQLYTVMWLGRGNKKKYGGWKKKLHKAARPLQKGNAASLLPSSWSPFQIYRRKIENRVDNASFILVGGRSGLLFWRGRKKCVCSDKTKEQQNFSLLVNAKFRHILKLA